AIPSISGDLLVKLSPNPITRADNTLNIELQSKSPNGHEQVAIEIYNIKGQSVLKEVYQSQLDARTYRVPASSLANGIYFCRVTCGKQQATGKFCVIK
ncbi:MAG: T9SS type A sorting domain-containing protein, partial [Candidatus Cloacimonadaceae bacterium]